MRDLTIGFVGLGLIGGSIARILKKVHPEYTLIAYNRSKPSLEAAHADGVIDIIAADIDSTFSQCDYIFLCTPVEYNSQYLSKLKPFVKEGGIVTDVGSVKGFIHKTVKELDMEGMFIGGHPMAGSEKTGYASASDSLLENAYYAITPTPYTKPEVIEEYQSFVRDMGAIPVVLDYNVHDHSVAGISHLPHVIASTLVNVVKNADNDVETMKMLAAGGFKDITRIASSSAEMWEQICMTNTEEICKLIDMFDSALLSFKDAISSHDNKTVHSLFDSAKEYRDSINTTSKGLIKQAYVFHCDLLDEDGAIAKVAMILALKHISIKNIGIIHNREYEQGVLRIEFYDNESLSLAYDELSSHGYTIYKN